MWDSDRYDGSILKGLVGSSGRLIFSISNFALMMQPSDFTTLLSTRKMIL